MYPASPPPPTITRSHVQDLTRVGRPNADPPQDIQLQGLGITNEHCIIELVNREVFLTPMCGSRQGSVWEDSHFWLISVVCLAAQDPSEWNSHH